MTADAGQDSMLVVWDTAYGTPKRTYFTPHENGVIAMDISPDSNFLITLSDPTNVNKQTLSLWDLEDEERQDPIVTSTFAHSPEKYQHFVRFNTTNIKEIVTNGRTSVIFFSWEDEQDDFTYYEPTITKNTFPQKIKGKAEYSQSVFIPNTTQAITATSMGDIMVFDISMIVDGSAQPDEKRLIKVVTCNPKSEPINVLMIHGNYVVTGNHNGSVKFYVYELKIFAWFEDLMLESIMSISFADLGDDIYD